MKWSLKTTYARHTKELKRNLTFTSLTLKPDRALLGDKSYRYNIKHVQHTNSKVYCKQEIQKYAQMK